MRQHAQTRELVKKHGTPGSDLAPRTEPIPTSRKQLPEWVPLLPVVAGPTVIVGGWVAGVTSSALFGIFYFALTKCRARRA